MQPKIMGRTARYIFVLALVSFTMVVSSWALQISAALTGVVKDRQDAVIGGAKITLINQDQGTTVREMNTQTDGSFLIAPLNPATYRLVVQAAGFKRFEQKDIKLNAMDRTNLENIVLDVGEVTETVEVEAQAVQLETQNAMRTGLVSGSQTVDLALNGRNYLDLVKTIPGVVSFFNGQVAGASNQGVGYLNVNGMRGAQNNVTLDGVSNLDTGNNDTQHTSLNIDAVAETRILTNGQSAEYGKASGATISVVTKSGTKDFHGTGYFFHRNEGLNANNWLNNVNKVARPIYRFNYQGYNIGGPVYIPGKFNRNKDKLFFFWGQEWQNQLVPGTLRQLTVPTAAERTGDYSLTHDAGGNLITIKDPTTGQPFPGNQIPKTLFNSDGQKILNWFPLPNLAGQPAYNYQFQSPDPYPRRQIMARGDYYITNKWRLFSRVVHDTDHRQSMSGWGTQNVSGNPFENDAPGTSAVVNLTTTVNPTLTNEFIFGASLNSVALFTTPALAPDFYASKYNFSYESHLPFPNANTTGYIQNWRWGGVSNPTSTNIRGLPFKNMNTTFEFTDNLSKVTHVHLLKLGYYIQRARKNQAAFGNTEGNIFFDRDSNNPGDTNWAYSNALIGSFDQLQQANVNLKGLFRYTNAEWYVADTWKARSNLTFDVGVRFYIVQPQYDARNQISSFNGALWDPSQAAVLYQKAINPTTGKAGALNPLTGAFSPVAYVGGLVPNAGKWVNGAFMDGIAQPGLNGYPRGLIKSQGVLYAPRFGVAWQFAPKTVFRAGGGVFYDRFQANLDMYLLTNPPDTQTPSLFYGNMATLGSTQGVMFPATINSISWDGKVSTVYNWNAGIQRELPLKMHLDVAYVGSVSRHLPQIFDVNRPGFGSAWLPQNQDPTVTPKYDGTTTLPVNLYRPYQGFGDINVWEFGGSSNYNGLQVAVNRRLGSGLSVGGSYTWSKAMGTAGSDWDTVHPTNIHMGNYAPLSFDRRQVLVFNYIYNLPKLGNGGSALNNRFTRAIVNGWILSGLTQISTGMPLQVTYSVSTLSNLAQSITGDGTYGPRIVLTRQPLGSANPSVYSQLNPAAFAPAAKGSVGLDSALDGYAYGPKTDNWDISLFKNFQFTSKEGRFLQLRVEAFNAPNHTQYGGSTGGERTSFSSGINTALVFNGSGQITNLPTALGGGGGRFGFGAYNGARDPRMIQLAAKFYF